MADNPLTPRPQSNNTSKPQGYQVTSQRVDLGSNIRPAPDKDLEGLMAGLQSFNPGINKYRAELEKQEEEQRQEERRLQEERRQEQRRQEMKAAAILGKAQGEGQDMGTLPLDLIPTPEAGLQGTAAAIQGESFREALVARRAVEAKSEILTQYAQEKDKPGFDLEGFLRDTRRGNIAGLPADMAAHMGGSLTELEGNIRQDFLRVRQTRLDESREANIGGLLQDAIGVADPREVAGRYFNVVQPGIVGQGKTRQEAASYLLNHLTSLSEKAGGRPEMFDAMQEKDPSTGRSIFELNPKLQPAILAAKEKAQARVDQGLEVGAQAGNALILKALDERVTKDPDSVTFGVLLGNLGKHGVFKTDNDVISYWRGVQKAKADRAGQTNLLQMATAGQLYMADEKDQKATMGALTAGVVSSLSEAISKGEAPNVSALADALVSAHGKAGSTAPSAPLQRMFEFIGKQGPVGDKPSPVFVAASELYRRLENSPQLREVYFDENAREVMQAYTQAVKGQAEPAAAYKAAYEVVSPEAKRRAEAFKQTPEFKEKLSGVTKWVSGSSWVPQMLGGNGRPENSVQLMIGVQEFAVDFLKRNPQATDADVQKQAEAWATRSFVLDTTTKTAIRVPAGLDPTMTREALSAYTERVTSERRLDERGEGWGLVMLPVNIEQGTYRVATAFNGAPVSVVEEVRLPDLIKQQRQRTLWLPEDAAALRQAQIEIDSGRSLSNRQLGTVLAKARQLGVDGARVAKIEAVEQAAAETALALRPKTDEGPDTSALFKDRRSIKPDSAQTAASAMRMLSGAAAGSTGLAASLITMGEGVMLTAYDDPATGAGKNIGTGYNLKANAQNAAADLRSAGVPAERIPGVIAGTLALSPEQSERLTTVAVGRYEKLAEAQVDMLHARLWQKLQPQQRAVLTDIAYQTGDVGQFKKAVAALTSGDLQAFREESKVFFTNRKGERVEDTRRGALRDAMLSGTAYWQQVVQRSNSGGPLGLQSFPFKTHQDGVDALQIMRELALKDPGQAPRFEQQIQMLQPQVDAMAPRGN